jgi:hypothetical protein
MNRKVVRNGLLVAAMCAVATLLPSQKAVADPDCASAACQECMAAVYYNWQGCQAACRLTYEGVIYPITNEWCNSIYGCNYFYQDALFCYLLD